MMSETAEQILAVEVEDDPEYATKDGARIQNNIL